VGLGLRMFIYIFFMEIYQCWYLIDLEILGIFLFLAIVIVDSIDIYNLISHMNIYIKVKIANKVEYSI
jgi:hypothetical protein